MSNYKKPRKIVVDGDEYFWRISRYNGDGDGGFGIKIWKNKKVFLEEWWDKFKNKEDLIPLTPNKIEGIIRDTKNKS